jgi:excisionase family DNA binding protein
MKSEELGDDILRGASAIADYLNESERCVYHWTAKGYIPTFKIGALICARKSELDALMRGKKGAA